MKKVKYVPKTGNNSTDKPPGNPTPHIGEAENPQMLNNLEDKGTSGTEEEGFPLIMGERGEPRAEEPGRHPLGAPPGIPFPLYKPPGLENPRSLPNPPMYLPTPQEAPHQLPFSRAKGPNNNIRPPAGGYVEYLDHLASNFETQFLLGKSSSLGHIDTNTNTNTNMETQNDTNDFRKFEANIEDLLEGEIQAETGGLADNGTHTMSMNREIPMGMGMGMGNIVPNIAPNIVPNIVPNMVPNIVPNMVPVPNMEEYINIEDPPMEERRIPGSSGLACPKCKKILQAGEDMRQHRWKNCVEEAHKCKYAFAGCRVKGREKQLSKHLPKCRFRTPVCTKCFMYFQQFKKEMTDSMNSVFMMQNRKMEEMSADLSKLTRVVKDQEEVLENRKNEINILEEAVALAKLEVIRVETENPKSSTQNVPNCGKCSKTLYNNKGDKCGICKSPLCPNCITRCLSCFQGFCRECILHCRKCQVVICAGCNIHCGCCGGIICKMHRFTCAGCQKTICDFCKGQGGGRGFWCIKCAVERKNSMPPD